jgi:hypothetical protein
LVILSKITFECNSIRQIKLLFKFLNIKTMAVTPVATLCNSLIYDLNAKPSMPENYVTAKGMYFALRSNQNRAGYEPFITEAENELRNKAIPNSGFPLIRVNIPKSFCSREATDTPSNPCTAVAEGGAQYEQLDVTVTGYKEYKFTISNAQFKSVCYDKDPYLANELKIGSETLLRDVDKDLISRANALMGNYTDGTSSLTNPRTLNLVNGAGAPNVITFPLVDAEYDGIGANNGYMVVGGRWLNMYNKALSLSVGNTAIGLDATLLPDLQYYYDSNSDAVLQECAALTWAKGAIQIMEPYRYTGNWEWIQENSVRTTMVINGVKFDYAMEFKTCVDGGQWTITLSKYFDLFYIPTEKYTCTGGQGNFKLKYLLGCGDTSCSDFNFCPAVS